MSRLFTFGCSYTSFYWPTYADILGVQFDEYQNWGQSGLGNRAIVEKLSECIVNNNITEDDVFIVQWTDFHRHDIHQPGMYSFGNWRSGGNIWAKPVEMEWVKDFWNEFSYTYHSMNFINLGCNLLETLPCKYFITSMIDYKPLIKNTPFNNYLNVIKDNWLEDFETFCKKKNYDGCNHKQIWIDETIKKGVPKVLKDKHPTPALYLEWLEEQIPFQIDNALATKIRNRTWTDIDTSNNNLQHQLGWDDSKYRVKGL